jgi:hypothetical protein
VLHKRAAMRTILSIASLWCAFLAQGATLESLSIEDMTAKSTVIVRGRINSCAGDQRGSVIYTRCRVDVTERWKGTAGGQLEFLVPGGTAHGLTQVFTGTPKFAPGSEYVLFLWAGRSGNLQVIGLSQGVFDVRGNGSAPVAKRAASTELMLNAAGQPVQDQAVQMTVTALRQRVGGILGGMSK